MMYLTVIVNILVLTTAIRVPTVWPEQEKKLLKDQHTRSSNVYFNNLLKTKLNVEQERADANSFVENEKNPIGSFTQTKHLNNNNKKQFYKEKPYVGHNVPHLYNRDSSLRMQATTNAENNNDRKVIKYNRVDTTVRHNNLKNASFSRPLFNTNNNNFPTDTDDWVPIAGHIDNHKIKESNNVDLLHDIKRKQTQVPHQKYSPIKSTTRKLSKDEIDITPKPNSRLNDSTDEQEDDLKTHYKRSDNENIHSEHELPKRIPTKPIYPGEGKWAIPGLKHTPYKKSNQVLKPVEEVTEEPEQLPIIRASTTSERNIPKWHTHAFKHSPYRNRNNILKTPEKNNENIGSTTENNQKLEEFPKRNATKSDEAKWAIHKFIHAPNRSINKVVKPVEENNEKATRQKERFEFPKRILKKPEDKFTIHQFTQSPSVAPEPIEDNKEETSENNENVESAEEDHEEVKENDKEEEYEDEESEDDEEEDFVPTRVFSQVRNSENEEHLPSHLLDTRLKESIKDSKIHTVYTEEGYEDVEYDHGGKEKNYKNSEGNVEFDKDAPKNPKLTAKITTPLQEEVDVLKEFEKYDNSNLEDENEDLENDDAEDAETSASNHENVKHNDNVSNHKYGRTKESKTTEIRNMNDGDMELEITSEIKTMMQPNNMSSTHKFVKIVPKYKIDTGEAKLLKPLKRNKRFTNDFHEVEVEKDFLDVLNINHEKEPIISSTVKYPYYNMKQTNILNSNSPLRYAEDLKRIPEKVYGEMSFYQQSKISECPEIPKNVDPVPEKVNKTEAQEGSSKATVPPELPRLKNLGDHLDCLKNKLFGENPLDSPIFQESVIEAPKPIFKEFIKESVQQNNTVPKSDLELQETTFNDIESINNTTNTTNYEDEENIYSVNGSQRQAKSENFDTDYDNLEEDESGSTEENETYEPLPESAPLIIRLRRRKRPHFQRKAYKVNVQKSTTFSPLHSYITTNRIPPRYKTISEVFYKDDIQPNEQLNVLHDVMNNIKSASLNDPLVADSSESVKNSFKYFNPQSDNDSVRKVKVPSRKIRIKHNDSAGNYQTINTYTVSTTSTTTTTVKPKRRIKIKKNNRKPSALVYEEYVNTVLANNKLNKEKDNYASADNSYITASVNTEVDDVVGLSPPIFHGLPTSYSSITNFNSPANHLLVDKPMNTFLVEGMNPPIKRKPVSYSEFRLLSKLRSIKRVGHYGHHVHKRSSNKPSYSDIRRNRPTEASVNENEEDEYMPQRNRNYYYDTKTRQVVYTGPQTEQPILQPEDDEEEEEEEEEDVKDYLVVTKPTTSNPVVHVTTEKNGPSFLEILQGLHNESNYQVIPEPVPTKSNHKLSATPEETEAIKNKTQAAIESPKFINFLQKLKTSQNYTDIPEIKLVVTTTTTTETPPEEEEEEEEEEENERTRDHFKNHNSFGNTQIFDISEYLPVPQSYQPKAIDYSKYKTINRTPAPTSSVQQTSSSDYNEDDISGKGHDSASDPTENSQIVRRTQVLERTTEMFLPVTNTITTTEKPKVLTTLVRKVIMRGRKRPTTTTAKPTSTVRLNLRRRSRPTTTTTEATLEEISTSATRRMPIRRVPIRRHSRGDTIPLNHKEVYTPIDENMKTIPKNELLNLGNLNETAGNRHELQTRNIADVEVFKKFNRKQKHGGNYKREELTLNSVPPTAYNIENSDEMRLTDIVPKPFSFYSDGNLPLHVNLLNVSEKEIEKAEGTSSNEEKNEDNLTNQEDVDNSEEVTEKLAAIVKDPSKRLYYYAPVK